MSFVVKSKPLNFTFDGKAYQGFEGDTLASALLRAGVKVIARSFKSVSYTHLTLPTKA